MRKPGLLCFSVGSRAHFGHVGARDVEQRDLQAVDGLRVPWWRRRSWRGRRAAASGRASAGCWRRRCRRTRQSSRSRALRSRPRRRVRAARTRRRASRTMRCASAIRVGAVNFKRLARPASGGRRRAAKRARRRTAPMMQEHAQILALTYSCEAVSCACAGRPSRGEACVFCPECSCLVLLCGSQALGTGGQLGCQGRRQLGDAQRPMRTRSGVQVPDRPHRRRLLHMADRRALRHPARGAVQPAGRVAR